MQVTQLKQSRDKLIAQVGNHLSDSDRMAAENSSLMQAGIMTPHLTLSVQGMESKETSVTCCTNQLSIS